MTNDISLEKTLPHDLESERVILGAVLLHPPALFEACEACGKDDFYLEAHRKIFDAFLRLQSKDVAIAYLTVKNELQQSGELEAVGGIPYIMQLTEGMSSAANTRHYAGIIHEQAVLRRLIQLGNDIMVRAYEAKESTKEIIDDLQLALIKMGEDRKKGGWRKIRDLVDEAYKELDAIAHRKAEIIGLTTGFRELNVLTQGMQGGNLWILAGRPGHGKSSLAQNIIATNVLAGKRVGLFTLEMGAIETTKRIILGEAEVDSHKISNGYVTKEDWNRIAPACARISETSLSLEESGTMTIMDVRSRAQQLAIAGGVDLIVVDYLQLMTGNIGHRSNQNREQEISVISRGLKALAKDLNVPILALSQLNRDVEKENRRPRNSDLRESGSLEQDADVVLFIYREELRVKKEDNEGIAELIIGKQRNGPVGKTIKLRFLDKYTKFVPLSNRSDGEDGPESSLWYQQE